MNRPTIANPPRCFRLLLAVLALASVACSSSAQTAPAATAQAFIALADCPVTLPTNPYVGRAPYLPQPPEYYRSVWYGTDDLWTILHPEGELWARLPNNGGNLTQKTWWLSRNFDIDKEREPSIAVRGTRLDSAGSFSAGNPGTHGWTDFGTAMLVGVEIPSEGCWEIAAEYNGARLAYVVLVE